jgi:hypothetical protein
MTSTTSPPADDLRPPLRDPRHAALIGRRIVGDDAQGIVVLMLDDASWPMGSFVIDDFTGGAAIVRAADVVAQVAVDTPQLARVVLVDVRTAGNLEAGDLDALLEATATLDALGVCLVELIVLTPELYVPVAAVCGLPSRW